jgi:lipopolysaccharide/colanic/teichoic acid biosynthesis glycosyltransferase
MRYQNPIPSPMAHYWEEEVISVWGTWLRLRESGRRFFNYLTGEVVFANIYLIAGLIANSNVLLGVRDKSVVLSRRISLGAILKRSIDVFGASIGLILTLPIWIIIPILIKLDSKGSIFYTQERVGINRRKGNRRSIGIVSAEKRGMVDRRKRSSYGKSFMILKFRTMFADAEKMTGPTWACKNDPRITRVGRIMRATRIDEIPQIFNVLMGDMSLVGPRPERPFFVDQLQQTIEDYTGRFEVKPGITGLAQVEHKYDENLADVSKKIKYDLNYIRNWNLLQDMKIIVKTVAVVLTARGM